MVVGVAAAVAEVLHQLGRRVQDVHRRRQRAVLLGRPLGAAERLVAGVRFRRGAEVDHRLRDRQLALGRAQPVVGVPRRQRLLQRVGIGHADVLDGEAHEAAGDVLGVLAAVEHAREPVERGIDVGAAQRLVQRADQVVVRFLRLVVERRALLQQRRQPVRRQRRGLADLPELLGQRDQVAAVAVGHREHRCPPLGVDRQLAAERRLDAVEQRAERRLVEAPQHQHLAARQQRGVQLERRVLGGGADQRHRAVLDVGQEAVLLGAVEAVDLVDEQQRALAVAPPLACRLEHAAQVGDAREHRRQGFKVQVGLLGQQAGDRRLAAAGRSPQDQRGELARRQHAAERALGAQQVVLSEDVRQRARPQPLGERHRGERIEQLGRHVSGTGRCSSCRRG